MDMQKNVWVVIAAYNEGAAIAETVTSLMPFINNVVVVDDCSKDQTFQKAQKAGAHTLKHAVNLGQGAALQTGIEYALKNGCNYVVTFDADGQHNPTEILPMLHALQQSNSDIVLGSRFLGKTLNLSWHRRCILKLAIIFTWITSGEKFSDVHNGFRIMTRKFCEKFEFHQNRMAHASEILNYISRNKVKFIEFPVTITYTNYSMAKGQKNSNALRVLMELLMGHISK